VGEGVITRIDPASVPELFRRVGLRAVRGVFGGDFVGEPCGCITTALAFDAIGPDAGRKFVGKLETQSSPFVINEIFAREALWIDPDYAVGLMFGWDGHREPWSVAGFEDGRAAWEAAVSAGVAMMDGAGRFSVPWGGGEGS
jgi:hypothetical protein